LGLSDLRILSYQLTALKHFVDLTINRWHSSGMKYSRTLGWTLLFIFLGYFGAAIFYAYLVSGIDAQTLLACPVCGCVITIGQSNLQRFAHLVLGFGTINALLFVAIGWLGIFMVRLVKRTTLLRPS
jgi:hypothetical protein